MDARIKSGHDDIGGGRGMDQDQATQSAIGKAAAPPHPVSLPLLCGEFPRPGECRLRRARHERRISASRRRSSAPAPASSSSAIILFEIPSNLALQRFGARIWIARIMISWGLVATAMALVSGETSFYVMRFLLGVAEAGFFPGIILYLTYWFPARERARIVSLFMAAVPLATVVGGPVSGALLELHGLGGLKGWQWLFVIEGLPAVLLGLVALKFLDDRPEQADWLTAEERRGARRARSRRRPRPRARSGYAGLGQALTRPRVLVLGAALFLHRGRAVRHRLLDAASDPGLRADAAQNRLPHRHPLSLRRHRHGAVGRALGSRPASASGMSRCRSCSPAAAFAWSAFTGPLRPDHGRAHASPRSASMPPSARSGRCPPRS